MRPRGSREPFDGDAEAEASLAARLRERIREAGPLTFREWMSAAPVTAERELPIDDAARLMLEGGFHHLPVIENDRPVGVVGLRSVVSALRRGFPGW